MYRAREIHHLSQDGNNKIRSFNLSTFIHQYDEQMILIISTHKELNGGPHIKQQKYTCNIILQNIDNTMKINHFLMNEYFVSDHKNCDVINQFISFESITCVINKKCEKKTNVHINNIITQKGNDIYIIQPYCIEKFVHINDSFHYEIIDVSHDMDALKERTDKIFNEDSEYEQISYKFNDNIIIFAEYPCDSMYPTYSYNYNGLLPEKNDDVVIDEFFLDRSIVHIIDVDAMIIIQSFNKFFWDEKKHPPIDGLIIMESSTKYIVYDVLNRNIILELPNNYHLLKSGTNERRDKHHPDLYLKMTRLNVFDKTYISHTTLNFQDSEMYACVPSGYKTRIIKLEDINYVPPNERCIKCSLDEKNVPINKKRVLSCGCIKFCDECLEKIKNVINEESVYQCIHCKKYVLMVIDINI